MYNANAIRSDRGQTIIVFAIVLPILALFTGMAIDAGLLYVTKAKLSTSVDAACLTGMKNLVQGQAIAASLAKNIFDANYGPNPPTPTVTFPVDASGNQQVKVTATAPVHTLFMQYLSQWTNVPVSATAVSTRGKLIMSIVLDRSGSMGNDGGETALKAAVPEFIDNFNELLDQVGMTSFSSNSTIDSDINHPNNPHNGFKQSIKTAVAAMTPLGGTFGTGAGTQPILSTTMGPPLTLAQLQNDSVTIKPGQNVVKVVVYFGDVKLLV
jgi:Flp pilus assembly protein TadG